MSELKANETGVIAVKELHKKVVLEFPYPSSRVILDPKTALGVANAMSECSYIADTGLHPANSLKTNIINDKYTKMVARVTIMLGGRKAKTNKVMAKDICDAVFSELT